KICRRIFSTSFVRCCLKKKFRDNCQQQKEICKTILNTPKLRQVFLEELESYKDKNITTLMAYGIK
ncbi:MAG TPA: hypothetical protein PLH98_12415, partial [Ruminococcus flavefaciens]|nr:hypothetical protein [Ruminococcus flavefaciens]